MRIAIAGDHAGFEMKELLVPWLQSTGHQVEDLGAHRLDPEDDYPDFAFMVADSVRSKRAERGVVVCGSGVGASVAANKVPGIRACLCHDTYTGRQGVEHDDMNVLCLGGRVIGLELAKEVLSAFLDARFISEVKYKRRLQKLTQVEENGLTGKF
jgi:ribose 5-phosphate isomerase B